MIKAIENNYILPFNGNSKKSCDKNGANASNYSGTNSANLVKIPLSTMRGYADIHFGKNKFMDVQSNDPEFVNKEISGKLGDEQGSIVKGLRDKSMTLGQYFDEYRKQFKGPRMDWQETRKLGTPESYMNSLISKYQAPVTEDLEEISKRASKGDLEEYLSWIGELPSKQLERTGEIYNIVKEVKDNGGKGKLGVIGMGGSRHTIENLLSLTGVQGQVEFLSAVDPESTQRFLNKLSNGKKTADGKYDLSDANVMIVSKSGTTYETEIGAQEVEKAFREQFIDKNEKAGLSGKALDDAVKQDMAKHFIAVTDAKSGKLLPRAQEAGYKLGVIHDGCGGRFGAFDDHVLLALAYSGMKEDDMKDMLKSSIAAQKEFLSTDLKNNLAAQKAMFNVDAIKSGRTNHYNYYFGDQFEGSTIWSNQLARESLKAICTNTDSVGPAMLHYATEGDLDPNNKNSFYTFITLKNKGTKEDQPYNSMVEITMKEYSKKHPVFHVQLKDLSPQTIGRFVELKHMETMLTGMLMRSSERAAYPEDETLKNPENKALKEVKQPSVEAFKNEARDFRDALKEGRMKGGLHTVLI